MFEDSPTVQEVPDARGWTGDQAPLAQRWYEVPPMQFQFPSVVQGPESAPAVELLEGGAGAAELATGAGVDATGAGVDATGVEAAALEVTGTIETPTGEVLNVPPELAGADETTGAADDGAAELAGGAEAATAAAQPVPVGATGVAVWVPNWSRASPGSGNLRSAESMDVQPFPIFAVNIFGRALYADWSRETSWVALLKSSLRFAAAAVRVTGAQFMYISRFPILLNQVQARVAVPVGKVVGIVKV
jgi:hypothetical protein